MLWIFLQVNCLNLCISSYKSYNQLRPVHSFCWLAFAFSKALNSVYQLHQHAISGSCFCLGGLIFIDVQDYIWDFSTIPCLSFICFEMHNLVSLEPYKIKSVLQHRHFIELTIVWTNTYCLWVQHGYVFAFTPKVGYQLDRLTVIPNTACFKQHS